jgi:DNA-binding transcriptional LysR family regulator
VSPLAGVDLNLLVALDALMQEGSVTKAAVRVGVSQPAMSNALKRLRRTFDDELLVRSGSSMVPTPRAMELAGPVHDALATIQQALEARSSFDPATAKGRFKLASSDYAELVLLPELVQALSADAPGMELAVLNLPTELPARALESGEVHLAVGVFREVPGNHVQRALFRDRFVCVTRKDHPALKGGLDLDTYCRLDHMLVSPRGRGPGVVDHFLEREGRKRRVALRVPHFLVAPLVVARSEMVLTLASRVACRLAEVLEMDIHEPPLKLPTFTTRMVWHARYQHDPAHRFLRTRLAEAASSVGEAGACS